MTKIIFILIPIILLTFSCTQSKNGGLVAGDSADTEVKSFSGITEATSTDEDEIKVCWHPRPGAKEYRIFMGKPGGCGTIIDYMDIVTDPGESCKLVTLQNPKPGSVFSISVRACDQYGNPDINYKTLDVTMVDLTPPNFNGLISAEATGNPREVLLTWQAATDGPYKYEIYYCKENVSYDVTIDDNFCPDESWEETNIRKKFDQAFKPRKIEKLVSDLPVNPDGQIVSVLLKKDDGIGFGFDYHFLVKACDKAKNCSDRLVVKSGIRPQGSGSLPIFSGIKDVKFQNQNIVVEWGEPQDAVTKFKVFISGMNQSLIWQTDLKKEVAYNDYISTVFFPTTINSSYPYYFPTYPTYQIASAGTFNVGVRACNGNYCDINVITKPIVVEDNVPPTFNGITGLDDLSDYGIALAFDKAQTGGQNDFQYYAIYKFPSCSGQLVFSDSNLVAKVNNLDEAYYNNDNIVLPSSTWAWVVRAVDTHSNMSFFDKNDQRFCRPHTQGDTEAPLFKGLKSLDFLKDGTQLKATLVFELAKDYSPIKYKIYRSITDIEVTDPLTLFVDGNGFDPISQNITCSATECVYKEVVSEQGKYYSYGVRAFDVPKRIDNITPFNMDDNTIMYSQKLTDIFPCSLSMNMVNPHPYPSKEDFQELRLDWNRAICQGTWPDDDFLRYDIYEKIDGADQPLRSMGKNEVLSHIDANGRVYKTLYSKNSLTDGSTYEYKIIVADTANPTNYSPSEVPWAKYVHPDSTPPVVGNIQNVYVANGKVNFDLGASSDKSGISMWYIFMKKSSVATFDYSGATGNCGINKFQNNCYYLIEEVPGLNIPARTISVPLTGLNIGDAYDFIAAAKDNPPMPPNETKNFGVSTNAFSVAKFPDYIAPVVSDVTFNIGTGTDAEYAFIAFKVTEANTSFDKVQIKVTDMIEGGTKYDNGFDGNKDNVRLGDAVLTDKGCIYQCVENSAAEKCNCIKVHNLYSTPSDWSQKSLLVKIEAVQRPEDGAGVDGMSGYREVAVKQVAFKGWTHAKVLGPTSTGSYPKIALRWDNMGTDYYNIYRADSKAGPWDVNNKRNTNLLQSLPDSDGKKGEGSFEETLTDNAGATATSIGKTYYYKVIPVPLPGQQEITKLPIVPDDIIEVIIPPTNMALVHRWIANRDMCSKLPGNRGFARDDNYTCAYTAAGSINFKYDLGANYLVDVYERSADGTNGSGNDPAFNISQAQAETSCMSKSITGGDFNIKMGLLSRKLFIAASSWDIEQLKALQKAYFPSNSLNEVAIALESSIKPDGTNASLATNHFCNSNNGYGISFVSSKQYVVKTGTTDTNNCISKYGIQDLVGNLWEWGKDWVKEGSGIPHYGQSELQGVTFLEKTTATTFNNPSNFAAILYPMGIPKTSVNLNDDQGIENINPGDDYYKVLATSGKTYGILQGGSWSNLKGSGRLALDISNETGTLPTGNLIGYRCAAKLGGHPIWKDATANSSKITLEWKNINTHSDLLEYHIYRSTVEGAKGVCVCDSTISINMECTQGPVCPNPSLAKSTIFDDAVGSANANPGVPYFYSVYPVTLAGDEVEDVITSNPNDWQIELMAPSDPGYTTVHRWIYNQNICNNVLSAPFVDNNFVETLNPKYYTNYTCAYSESGTAPGGDPTYTNGTVRGYFDVGGQVVSGLMHDFYIAKDCAGPDGCYTDASTKYGIGFNTVDKTLLFRDDTYNVPLPFGKQEFNVYRMGHWYKAGQKNIHLVDNYYPPEQKTPQYQYVLITGRSDANILRWGVGTFYFLHPGTGQVSITGLGVPAYNNLTSNNRTIPLDNWVNAHLTRATNPCGAYNMRIPRKAEINGGTPDYYGNGCGGVGSFCKPGDTYGASMFLADASDTGDTYTFSSRSSNLGTVTSSCTTDQAAAGQCTWARYWIGTNTLVTIPVYNGFNNITTVGEYNPWMDIGAASVFHLRCVAP